MKEFKMNKKKLIIVTLLVMIMTLGTFVFIKREDLSERLKSIVYYNHLNSTRQELYNKLMISSVEVKNRTTGTAPFSSGTASNTEGIDVSASDNYVRTSDKVQYKLEVATKPNNGDFSSSSTSGLTGGVIKVKATLPNQGNNINLTWGTDAWMKGVQLTDNNTVITAEYHVASGTNITAAIQELSFTVLVGGYKTQVTSSVLPEFEVWMEGNSPENPTSTAPSLKVKDTRTPFIISGTPSYNVSVVPDYDTVKISKKTIAGVEREGRYEKVGVAVTLTKLTGMPDFRGVEYPKDEFNINFNLIYLYALNEVNSYSTLTASTSGAIDVINGTHVQAADINGRLNDNFYPNNTDIADSERIPYGELSLGTSNNSVYNSGDFKATITGNTLNVSFKNYQIKNQFPIYPTNINSMDHFNEDEGYILTGVVEFFLPFYGDLTTDNRYLLDIIAESANYKRTDGSTGTINKGTTYINDNNQNDNYIYINFENRLSTSFRQSLYLLKDNYYVEPVGQHYGDASLYIGDEFQLYTSHGQSDGNFLGGQQLLIAWDASKMQVNKKDGEYYILRTTVDDEGNIPPSEKVKMKFGVAVSTPTIGLTTLAEINSATIDSFTWYDTYEAASATGKVTAALFDDPEMYGSGASRYYRNNFKLSNDKSTIGNTSLMRIKVYAYPDEERQEEPYILRDSVYSPATYDETGNLISYEDSWAEGKTILVKNNETSVLIRAIEEGSVKSKYDIQDNIVNYEVTSTMYAPEHLADTIIPQTYVHVTLENGLSYVQNSANKEPQSVTVNADGSTKITWLYENWQVNTSPPEYSKITFQAEISPTTSNNHVFNTKAVIFNTGDKRDEKLHRTSTSSIEIINLTGVHLSKKVNKNYFDIGENIDVITTVGNSSGSTFNQARITEILPKNNLNGNKINGTYSITLKSINSNQKVYYSTQPINNLGLKYEDGKYSSEGISLTSPNWTAVSQGGTIPATATVMISEFSAIAESTSLSYVYTINTTNNHQGDVYYFNSAFSSVSSSAVIANNELAAYIANRSISGQVLLDNGTPAYEDELKVTLFNSNNQEIKSITTDNKKYVFNNLSRDKYYVQFEIPQYYEVLNSGTNKADANGKTSLVTKHYSEPTDKDVKEENVDMVIRKKQGTLTVHHYIENTTTPLVDSVATTLYYGESYSISPSSNIPNEYELASSPQTETGTMLEDRTFIYYYRLKTSTITVNHYKEGTTEKLADSVILKVKYTESYTTTPAIVDSNYELATTPENANDIANGDIEVNYYYKLKTATITVNHYIEGTTTKLAEPTVFTKKYTEKYEIKPTEVDSNYEPSTPPENATGTVNGDMTFNYYYKLKTATITVHHYLEETTQELAPTVTFTKKYTEDYTTERVDVGINYEPAGSSNNTFGKVTGNVTVIYYYKLKGASLIINHYIEGTTEKLGESIVKSVKWGENYTSYPLEVIPKNYELVSTLPNNANGIISSDRVEVNYYYRLKRATLTVNHYIEGTTTELAPTEESTVYWGKEYKTNPSDKVSINYRLVKTPENANGTVEGNITVTYYYVLKDATLTVNHYIEGTTEKLAATETIPMKWGQNYTVTHSNLVSTNYSQLPAPSNASGVISGDVTVNFYYRLKTATLIVNHLEEETNNVLAPQETKTVNYGDTYTTSISSKLPNNYHLTRKTDNYTGIVGENIIEVTYYYKKTDSKLSTSIKATGPTELTSREQKIKYTIKYEATINEYIGNGTVTITNKLPYEIDESKSNLNGGKYDSSNKTVTWTQQLSDIDTYQNKNNKVDITKEITVLYKDIVIKDKTFVNTVEGYIKLDNNEQTIEDKTSTSIKIKGTIVVHHYLEGTTNKIADDVITTGLVDETYISSAINKNGYNIAKKPEIETHTYQEKQQEIVYEYSRIQLKITTKVNGIGGKIEGDEFVYYGDNSTPDKIIITAEDGYDIAEIIVNGESYKVTDKKSMVLGAIHNIQKDIEIEVKFIESKEIINPDTSININVLSFIGLSSILVLIYLGYRKFKNKFLKI